MSVADEAPWRRPTRWSQAVYRSKAGVLQLRRAVADLGGPRRLGQAPEAGFPVVLGISETPLHTDVAAGERSYEVGKIENLRQAARRLDGVCAPAGQVFSFWRQLGPATAARGFVVGRMLQEGCLVPAVGGGLCQLSNALFDAALQARCGIVERHRHSRRVPGSAAALGRDATVAWNYVDFRFRAPRDLRLSVELRAQTLRVTLAGRETDGPASPADEGWTGEAAVAAARSCADCGDTACFRHEPAEPD